ncbi:MAG: glycosyltransferase family 39 protein [Planctomycetaceae bacterium]|jgi:hypothetical protein|nr:glycosyltransferase family 39 protein [Planctomycetaceae bacterium]
MNIIDRQIQSKKRKAILEVLLLILLGLIIFLPRLQELPYKGEEPRRVICAQELLFSGNLFVPTIQGELFLSRPPFQNWVIAVTGTMLGNFGHLSGRLPSVFSVIATALLIYFYCRTFFSGMVPVLAGLLFLSTFHVLKYGGVAETEMLFTFLLAGSYLFWHAAEHHGWSNTTKWTVAYLFLTCATLNKGFTQAPLYFCTIIGLSLFLNKRLSNLFTYGHLIGFSLYLGLFGMWQMIFYYSTNWEATQTMLLGDVSMRFEQKGVANYLEHWVVYPLEQFAVLFPWSIFLLAFLSSDFRNRLKPFPAPVKFCLGAIAVTFFTVWLPPGAKTRYYIPMIPCFVILSAVVIEQCQRYMQEMTGKKETWFQILILFRKMLIIIVSIFAPICCLWSACNMIWAESHIVKIFYLFFPIRLIPSILLLLVSVPIFITLIYTYQKYTKNAFITDIIVFVLFIASAYNLLFIDILKTKYEDVGSSVTEIFRKIPPDTELRSIGHTSFPFVYYYMFQTGKMLRPAEPGQKFLLGQYFCISEDEYLRWNPENVEMIERFNTSRFKPGYSKEKNNQMMIVKITVSENSSPFQNIPKTVEDFK